MFDRVKECFTRLVLFILLFLICNTMFLVVYYILFKIVMITIITSFPLLWFDPSKLKEYGVPTFIIFLKTNEFLVLISIFGSILLSGSIVIDDYL